MKREPILVDCVSGGEPHHVDRPLLIGAPTGDVCRACGDAVELDEEGLTKPHKTQDVLAMLARGDYD